MNASFEIDISAHPSIPTVDVHKLQAAIEHGLKEEQVRSAVLSITLVDNATIHKLNREHLSHDYPTDVMSFQLDWTSEGESAEDRDSWATDRSAGASLEGEIVVSVEYAQEMAGRCGWSTQDEMTLYSLHGMLHICGYDDLTMEQKAVMRSRERAILSGLGLTPQYPDDNHQEPTSQTVQGQPGCETLEGRQCP